MSWKSDIHLQQDLQRYVQQNLRRAKILDFIRRDYLHYFQSNTVSLRTLDRMLKHFDISYIKYDIPLETIRDYVYQEWEGPGQKLGYRALTTKLRQEYGLSVPRDVVYAMMTEIDDRGLQQRQPFFKRNKRKRGRIHSNGVNSVLSIDGHDKLMGYQNSTFPIAVYGVMDQTSRKILLLKCWSSNSDPLLIGRWYADWLGQHRVLEQTVRLDRGTETGKLAAIHAYLRGKIGDIEEPTQSVIFGPSTTNQIERWWRELHERLEKYFKEGLHYMLSNDIYNPHDVGDRNIMSFIMIPLIQQELNIFRESVWNSHRIRNQRETNLPCGIPNHMYEFPEQYGMRKCGFNIRKDDIDEAAELSGVNGAPLDYLDEDFRRKCELIIPYPEEIPSSKFVTAFKFLKQTIA